MNLELSQLLRYRDNPAEFRDDLLIDVDGVVVRFGDVMDPWQRDDFAALDPGMMRCTGHSDDPSAKMRFYGERSRGHSKTTDIAVTCTWALAFASRPIRGYCFAADKDQAQLLKDGIETIVRLNPWLSKLILTVQRDSVVNCAEKGHPGTGARLDIFTSDVGSSYGILPDLIIADELSHWEGDGSLWHSIISSAAKRLQLFARSYQQRGIRGFVAMGGTRDGSDTRRLDILSARWASSILVDAGKIGRATLHASGNRIRSPLGKPME